MPEELGQINTNTIIVKDGDIISCWSVAKNNVTATGEWFRRQAGTSSDTCPFVAVTDMTIIAVGITNQVVTTWSVEILADSGTGPVLIHTITGTADNKQTDTGLAIDINQGDLISIRQGTGTSTDPSCDIYLKSR